MGSKVSCLNADQFVRRMTLPGSQLEVTEIKQLCTEATRVLLNDHSLLELSAPIIICGDLHGQFRDLLRIFQLAGWPPRTTYLFMGDYVDRGDKSIETICLLLACKLRYPNNVFLMRGNHESRDISRVYGFYDECRRRYREEVWEAFMSCFDCLPVAAVIDSKIFCCHGGLSPLIMESLDPIRNLKRPIPVPRSGLLCDLMWADPDETITGWKTNVRGVSYTFGKDVLKKFLENNRLDMVVRGHQQVARGYDFFGNEKNLVTLYTAPFNDGQEYILGAIMKVSAEGHVGFETLRPIGIKLEQKG